LHLHLFNFLYRVRDLRPRWSTRRRDGFSCAILYKRYNVFINCSDTHCTSISPSSRAQHTRLCPVVAILLNTGQQVYEARGGEKFKSPFFYLVALLCIISIFPFFKDLFHGKYVQHILHSLNRAP